MPQAGREFLAPWIQGIPVTPGVWVVVVAPSPLILGVLELLGVGLSLGGVGLVAESVPEV